MNKKDLTDLRTKTIKELEELIDKKRFDSVLEYAKRKAGKGVSLKDFRIRKIDIAQIMTIIGEKKMSDVSVETK